MMQSLVIQTIFKLENSLDNQRLHHSYLFTGTRGVGKTTLARILAKCLNCETNNISSKPCGDCSSCISIDLGQFVDLYEVDAAASTSYRSTNCPKSMDIQLEQSPQGFELILFVSQFRHFANILAKVVFPTPLVPVNK